MGVDKSGNRVRRMFGQIAPRYDFLNHVLSMNIDRYWRWRTARLAASRGAVGSAPILDVCTGTGDLALALWRRTRGRVPIVGVDFCSEMLELGRRKAARQGAADQLTFQEADAQSLPFADGVFQIVAVAFGLRNVTDTDRGLREMARVCRPGGRVAILEFSLPRHQPVRAIYGWYFRQILPRLGHWLARNEDHAYRYLPDSVDEFPEGEALAARMRAAGLRQVRVVPFTLGIATLYMGEKPEISQP